VESKVFNINFDLEDSNSLKLVYPFDDYCCSCGITIQVYFRWKESEVLPGLEIENLVYEKVIENSRYEFVSKDNMAMTILSEIVKPCDHDNDGLVKILSLESIKVPACYIYLVIDQLDENIPLNDRFFHEPNIPQEKKSTLVFENCDCDGDYDIRSRYRNYWSDEYLSDDDCSFNYDDYDRFDD